MSPTTLGASGDVALHLFGRAVDPPLPGWLAVAAAALAVAVSAATSALGADLPKVTLAMSGWTGFAPITLAQKAGIFERNGVQVEIKKMPTSNRHQAMASGDVQAITTTVDTHILYASSGVPVTQVLVLDTSAGGDGIAARDGIASLKDAKGKSVAAIYREFTKVPKVTGGTDFEQIWRYIEASRKRKNELSLIITDFEWYPRSTYAGHPKNLYYAPVSNTDWTYITRAAKNYVDSMAHIEPNLARRLVGLYV